MKDSIDTASSILMIILLILTVIFAGIFCAVEIYSETITVVQLGNDVLNWTLYHQPELMNMFPAGNGLTVFIVRITFNICTFKVLLNLLIMLLKTLTNMAELELKHMLMNF